ncbi:WD40-repeat-containing domain protein [Apiosordaria backusii]|uniref:WD40-repeat-containing domain protein n=1 Tax=Apiosordaria backusii TaxID=314023 RepID=A0AA40K6X0_9PEZI|nr:WD40-repeat-containing domain protein [Apiosordaria backusii]
MAQTSPPHPQTQLQHNFVLSPITALEFYLAGPSSSYLLAGEDTWLKIYDVATSHLVNQLRVFRSQPIHGIHAWKSEDGTSTTEGAFLIWGGQSVMVLSPSLVKSLIQGTALPELPTEFQVPDWIYDGILFSSNGEVQGALVTAHNEIVTLTLSSNGNLFQLGPVVSPSRPILYSANLTFLGNGTILVAGGTVFGEIIVWKFHLDSSPPPQWEVLYVFTGHEGSVFGVTISPEIEVAPGSKIRLLGSCSDDRTIRIWDITDRQLAVTQNGGEIDSKTLGEARETGFGGNSEVKEENKNDSTRGVAVAMGHLSRIWHVKFGEYTPGLEGPINVYSFGEDTTRQRWELSLDLAGSQGPKGALKHCTTDSCHSGKNIWSAAVSNREGQASFIATGGADGKIVISGGNPTPGLDGGYEEFDLSLAFDDVLEQIQRNSETPSMDPLPKGNAKHAFQKYAFLSDSRVITTTSPGRIFAAGIQETPKWKEIQLPDEVVADLRSYNVMKSVAMDTVVLGSSAGNIYLLQHGKSIRLVGKLSGKIQDVLPLVGAGVQDWQAVITVLGDDRAYILSYNALTDEATIGGLTLSLPEHYIATAAAQVGSTIILGSRVGVVTLYPPSEDNTDTIPPGYSCRDPKTKDAITAIVPLPGSSSDFLTTCRDGKYRIYSLGKENCAFTLYHEISPPMGMIEGAWFTSTEKPELILHGFKGKQFIHYNDTTSTVLASIECGGAHRSFDVISPRTNPNAFRLIFTKSSHLRFYSQPSASLRTLKEGGHGREIRAVACSATFKYIATAAEDTIIRIWTYSPTRPGIKCLATLEKHSSGIQSLQWLGDDCLISSAGSEELFVWRITQIDSHYETLAVKCEAVWNFCTKDKDLRIMSFDTSNVSSGGVNHELAIALSNSTVHTYSYNPKSGEFEFGSEARYTGACPMQLRYMPNGEDIMVAYTDGRLAIWTRPLYEPPPQAEMKLANKAPLGMGLLVKLHQSSIKSLDAVSPRGGRWIIATGGDDNALIITELGLDDMGKYKVGGRYRVSSAHGAAVTGLRIVRNEEDLIEVVTVSNGQRIKLWRAEPGRDGRGMRISLQDNKYSGIADAGDVEVISSGKVMVGGVGLEVWDFNPLK